MREFDTRIEFFEACYLYLWKSWKYSREEWERFFTPDELTVLDRYCELLRSSAGEFGAFLDSERQRKNASGPKFSRELLRKFEETLKADPNKTNAAIERDLLLEGASVSTSTVKRYAARARAKIRPDH